MVGGWHSRGRNENYQISLEEPGSNVPIYYYFCIILLVKASHRTTPDSRIDKYINVLLEMEILGERICIF